MTDLPEGVEPVRTRCRDPQFFPGAAGLIEAASWNDVIPGSGQTTEGLLDPPRRGVLVLGNYQATASSYRRLLDGTIGGFPTTWRVLSRLLQSVPPRDVFLTNAYLALPDLPKDTMRFPSTPLFDERCRKLLALELELFGPRLVVCLGVPAAKMLASLCDELSRWRPWPGFKSLKAGASGQCVHDVAAGGCMFDAVVVPHPSAVVSNAARADDQALIALAARRRSRGGLNSTTHETRRRE